MEASEEVGRTDVRAGGDGDDVAFGMRVEVQFEIVDGQPLTLFKPA